MTMTVEITVDRRQMRVLEEELKEIPNGLQRVLIRAVNQVGVAARTKVIRAVTEELNLKTSEVRERNMRLSKANFSRLSALLTISGRRVPLIKFGASKVRRGVSYAIRRGERKLLPSGFVQEMPSSGRRGAFVRTGSPTIGRRLRRRRGPGRGMAGLVRPRKPITERYGPSIPQAVEHIEELSAQTLEAELGEKLEAEIVTQAGLVIASRRRS